MVTYPNNTFPGQCTLAVYKYSGHIISSATALVKSADRERTILEMLSCPISSIECLPDLGIKPESSSLGWMFYNLGQQASPFVMQYPLSTFSFSDNHAQTKIQTQIRLL